MKAKLNQFFDSLTPQEANFLRLVLIAFSGVINLLMMFLFAFGLSYALFSIARTYAQPELGSILGVMLILYVFKFFQVEGYFFEDYLEPILERSGEDDSLEPAGTFR